MKSQWERRKNHCRIIGFGIVKTGDTDECMPCFFVQDLTFCRYL
jgi:hypothetical protein